MLACIACSKRLNDGSKDASDEHTSGTPRSPASREAIGNLAAQIKDTTLRLSGAHRRCTVSNLNREGQLQRCIDSRGGSRSETARGESSSSTPAWRIISASSKGHVLSNNLCANTSRNSTPMFHSSSGSAETMMEEEDEESKEWISQVEPGINITLVSLKGGQNELKRIRFSREMFNKEKAQGWWAENCDKIMELYNVNAHAEDKPSAIPTPPRSEDERDSKMRAESGADNNVTPPLQNRSLLPGGLYASRTSSFRDADRPHDLQSKDNSSKQELDQEHEWVEEEAEPGVYVTIRCSPTGSREIKRVKFSRQKFSEMQAKLWWEENRVRIHEDCITASNLV